MLVQLQTFLFSFESIIIKQTNYTFYKKMKKKDMKIEQFLNKI